MYVPVTGWSGGEAARASRAQPIFSVGPGSRFYSPFWQMIYVEVPRTASATSVGAQILDGKYPLHPSGGGWRR